MDELQASGQLDRLLRSGLRFSEKLSVLDAHAAGETEEVSVKRIGPDFLFGRMWNRLGFGEIIKGLSARRRHEIDLERAVYLTVLHRLFAPGSDRTAEGWKENYKLLWMVEDTFRTAKTILETRPIFHKRNETIRGHMFCSFLALCLRRELQIALDQKKLKTE
ncbi:MAG: hypothetical protein ACKV19_16250 [Verrucomicrobiales bacterium]